MLTLPDHFKELLSAIEPEPERADAAQKAPAQVRDFLKESTDIRTIEPHSRLAGSYARHTALKNIKDVDILLFVAPECKYEEPEDVLEAVFKALAGLPEALEDEGEVTVRRRQRRSVNVHLVQQDFDLDIVPALAPKGLTKPLLIPDREWSKWVSTHPLGYATCLSTLNQGNGGKVVPLIKLLKHWRDVHMVNRRPKSYWLECLVYGLVADGTVETSGKSYAELFRDVLLKIQDSFSYHLNAADRVSTISDPVLGNNVAFNWERPAFESFMRRVDESLGWAERALGQDDRSEAVDLWRKVFGEDWFPFETAAEKGARLRAAVLAGNYYVTQTGGVHTTKPAEPHVQPPSQRFYGDR